MLSESKRLASWLEILYFTVGFGFITFWSFGHGFAYFTWSFDDIFDDFKATLFRPNITADITEGFKTCCLEPIFNQAGRLAQLRLHITLSATSALLMILQLLPQVRLRSFARHRLIGKATNYIIPAWIMQMTYLMFVRGVGNLPDIIWWFDLVALVQITLGYTLGVRTILLERNIEKHRAWMMVAASGMFMNAIQRLTWVVFCKSNTTMLTFEDWIGGPTTLSCVSAGLINSFTALYYGWLTKPTNADLTRGRKIEAKVA